MVLSYKSELRYIASVKKNYPYLFCGSLIIQEERILNRHYEWDEKRTFAVPNKQRVHLVTTAFYKTMSDHGYYDTTTSLINACDCIGFLGTVPAMTYLFKYFYFLQGIFDIIGEIEIFNGMKNVDLFIRQMWRFQINVKELISDTLNYNVSGIVVKYIGWPSVRG